MTKKAKTTPKADANGSSALATIDKYDVTLAPTSLTFDKHDIVNIGVAELERQLQEEFDFLADSIVKGLPLCVQAVRDFVTLAKSLDTEAEKRMSKKAKRLASTLGLGDDDYDLEFWVSLTPGDLHLKRHEKFTGTARLAIDLDCLQYQISRPGPISHYSRALRRIAQAAGALPNLGVFHYREGCYELNDQLYIFPCFRLTSKNWKSASVDSSNDGFYKIAMIDDVVAPKEVSAAYQKAVALYDEMRRMDKRFTEVAGMLQDLPKIERQMKATLAKRVLDTSDLGKSLIDTLKAFNAEQLKAFSEHSE